VLATLMIKMGIERVIGVQRGRMRRREGLVGHVLLCSWAVGLDWDLGLRLRLELYC
jgi:hypothetical protein